MCDNNKVNVFPKICDSKLRILNVNALFPGSTNDSYIWNNCDVLPILEQIYRNGQQGYFLLGMFRSTAYYLVLIRIQVYLLFAEYCGLNLKLNIKTC